MLKIHDLITPDPLPQVKDYLVYPWLYPGRLCLMVGPTNIGKTTLTLEIVSQLLKGDYLWGRYPAKKIERILYLHAEHTIETLQEAAKHRGDIPQDTVKLIHEFGNNGPAIITPQGNPTPLYLYLKESLVPHLQPQLIIAEPISAFIGSSENDNHEARMVVYLLANLGASCGAAVLTHHHPGKSIFDPTKPKPDGIASGIARGAMAFEDASETVIYLNRDGKKDDNHITIETPKSKGTPIYPVTLKFDSDTLSYTHIPRPFQERDIVAIADRMRKYPNEKTTDIISYFRDAWKGATTEKIILMMKRARRIGLIPEADIA